MEIIGGGILTKKLIIIPPYFQYLKKFVCYVQSIKIPQNPSVYHNSY